VMVVILYFGAIAFYLYSPNTLMANRTFLISSDEPYVSVPYGNENKVSILAAASYMIPVFWYGLFCEKGIALRKAATDDGAVVDYPIFQAKRDEALTRLESFQGRVKSLFRSVPVQLLHSFESFLRAAPGSWLAVETSELWMMEEPAVIEQVFRRCLQAAAGNPDSGPSWRFWRPKVSPQWQELLAQANVNLAASDRIEPSSLFGYSWIKAVPWEENS
jgi:hypothetical protein